MTRFLGLILAVAVIGGFAAASQARSGSAPDETPPGLELTYTKWFAPGFPNMVGVVGGDIAGRFGGAVLERSDPTLPLVHLTAVYIVVADDPAESFTAHVEGVQDNHSLTAVLDGRIVDGYLKRAHVHVEAAVITCTQAPNGRCFQGTISVTRSSDHSGD